MATEQNNTHFSPGEGSAADFSGVTERMGGRFPLRVYKLDNSYTTVLVDAHTKADEVVQQLVDKMDLQSPDVGSYLALYECQDGANITRALQGDEKPLEVVQSWGDNSPGKVVFQIKLFMDALHASDDPKIVQMLYNQAVYNIITGVYFTTDEKAAELASMQFFHKFGPHNPETHIAGFLGNRLVEYIPQRLMANKRADQWESAIFSCHAKIPEDSDAVNMYLNEVETWDTFGCCFFWCRRDEQEVFLAVNAKGIQIMDGANKDLLQTYKLSEIYRWGFRPGLNFYFEVKQAGATPILEFSTEEGNRISELLTDYAMAFLRQLNMEEEAGGGASMPPPNADACFGGVDALAGGAIKDALVKLRDGPTNQDEQQAGMDQLSDLAENDNDMREQIIEADGHKCVLAGMNNHISHPGVQQAGMITLSLLATDGDGADARRQKIVAAGGADTICRAMQELRDDDEIKDTGLGALEILGDGSDDRMNKIERVKANYGIQDSG